LNSKKIAEAHELPDFLDFAKGFTVPYTLSWSDLGRIPSEISLYPR
jgi:hypothetical protein